MAKLGGLGDLLELRATDHHCTARVRNQVDLEVVGGRHAAVIERRDGRYRRTHEQFHECCSLGHISYAYSHNLSRLRGLRLATPKGQYTNYADSEMPSACNAASQWAGAARLLHFVFYIALSGKE